MHGTILDALKDSDPELLRQILTTSVSYREALTRLGRYYCTANILAIRKAAARDKIEIAHLSSRSRSSLPEGLAKQAQKDHKRHKVAQKLREGLPYDYARFIFYDSRRADKNRGHVNDLTLAAIQELLRVGVCSYCGDATAKLTLDRKDNARGHTLDNVEVACVRCNIMRGNMPFEAWLHLVPAVRSAYEQGLFNGWMPFNRRYVARRCR